MSKFTIFNKRISSQNTNNVKFKAFYSIPVSPIKVIITTGSKPKLNHFERAVLALYAGGFYTTSEISDMLLIDKDLVELIISELKLKKYIDDNCKPCKEIIDILKNNHENITTKICYVFYDYNRGVLLPQKCESTEIVIDQTKNNLIEIKNLAYTDVKKYTPIVIKGIKPDLNEDNLKRMLARDINKDDDECFIEAEILDIDKKHYDLVGYVETIMDENNSSRWQVINPISLECDNSLQQFFFDQYDNPGIVEILKSLMELRKGSSNDAENQMLYSMVKNDLFTKQIKPAHEIFIDPLIRVIRSLSFDSVEGTYDGLYSKMDAAKNAIINLTDMFEKVLYQAALENTNSNDLSYICNDRNINIKLLGELAESKGFNVNFDSEKLFSVTKRNLNKAINNPMLARISECISWNLIVARNDDNYFFNKIPYYISDQLHHNDNSIHDGSSFINMMYVFKRDERDASRHSTKVSMATPKEYVDLLFEIMDMAFGYKLNKKTYDEYIATNKSSMDYSYAYEYLRQKIGPRMFDTNNERITALKINLISMYNNLIIESPDYLAKARAVVEELSKYIVNNLILSFNIKDTELSQTYFDDAEKYVEFIKKLGFSINTNSEIGNEVIGALNVDMHSRDNLERSFKEGFRNSNLRIKLQGILVCAHSISSVEELLIKNMNYIKNLFVTITEIMYLDRAHQQNHKFDFRKASVVCDDVIELTNNLLKTEKIINWER